MRFFLLGEPPQSPYQHAGGLRAVVLGWIAAGDAGLAETLHEANVPKPYTISPLWWDEAQGAAAFEVTVRAEWLAEPLLRGVRETGPRVRLGVKEFELRAPRVGPRCSWDELAGGQASRLDVELELVSPTAVHASGPVRRSVFTPDPALYYRSWRHRWNLYAPEALQWPESVLTTAAERMAVSDFSGRTERVTLDEDLLERRPGRRVGEYRSHARNGSPAASQNPFQQGEQRALKTVSPSRLRRVRVEVVEVMEVDSRDPAFFLGEAGAAEFKHVEGEGFQKAVALGGEGGVLVALVGEAGVRGGFPEELGSDPGGVGTPYHVLPRGAPRRCARAGEARA